MSSIASSSRAEGDRVRGDDIPGASAMIGELREEVQCPICLQRLTRPRVLSCLHSFCESCLRLGRRIPHGFDDDEDDDEDYYGDIIRCAVCRKLTELPAGGISGLKLDFRANRFCEILNDLEARKRKFSDSSEHRCEICALGGEASNVPAADYCQDCGKLFCAQCSKVHRRLPDTEDHHVVSVEGLMTGRAKLRKTQHESDTYKTCSEHFGERYKYFCKKCIRPVCSLCASFGPCKCHPEDVLSFDDAIPEMSGVVQMLIDRLTHRQNEVNDLLDTTEKATTRAEAIKKTSVDKLQKRHSDLIRLLNVRFQRAVNDRVASFGNKINDLRDVTEKARKMKAVSEKAIGVARDVIKEDIKNGKDLATSYGCLRSVLDSILPDQLSSLERNVSTIDQAISSMPDVKMKGVRLEWTPDEQLTVEPILLDGQVRGQQSNVFPPTSAAAPPMQAGPGTSRNQAQRLGPRLPLQVSYSQPLLGPPGVRLLDRQTSAPPTFVIPQP